MTDTITIVCLVHHDKPDHAFAVDIDKAKLVSHLKDLIKEKKENDFCDVDSDQLTLWQVNIPSDDADADARPPKQRIPLTSPKNRAMPLVEEKSRY